MLLVKITIALLGPFRTLNFLLSSHLLPVFCQKIIYSSINLFSIRVVGLVLNDRFFLLFYIEAVVEQKLFAAVTMWGVNGELVERL